MSVLSRAAAPPATDEVAGVVAALLTNLDHAPPARLPTADEPSAPDIPDTSETPAPEPVSAPLGDMTGAAVPFRLLGPRGLGAPFVPRPPAPDDDPPDGAAAHGGGGTGQAGPVIAQADALPVVPDPGPEGTDEPSDLPGIRRFPQGPTGFGTTSLRPTLSRTTVSRTDSDGDGQGRPASRRDIPALYCPPPVRDDPLLAEAVNEGITLWAQSIGLYEGRLDELRKADFGRLIMLAHPDCDDPDRLLAAAKCAVSEWSVDDYYCEEDADDRAPDGTPSSAEAELGPRLELAAAAIDPVHLPAAYQAQLECALEADPILRAFRTSFEHLSHYATPAQLARLRTEIAGWFIALGAEAGWRTAGRMPPVWEYLTNRQPHSFLPCMAPIDAVGGYELSAPEYTDPRVRRVVTTAALAAQMVNDLYSMAREDLSGGREFNLPTVLAAEEDCPRREAVRRTAEIHDELMHRFEREAAPLAAAGSPELRRFLGGLWAWQGGNRAWHADSRRYHDKG
ncbi:family 2 encapsulin nanocompartment cargo protein terpene cyclase [Nocardia sp. BMG51109]|uniref:family 2 encapsulin nanocompartment cargo protein terpene cyclase n=1 Tax=Nocardia sp. BMG51109 TaxID=1056816 RepID=UPI000465C401|nr:family 2 encapsulin nanocompartment cargo protein terpene cyclase [Nocardia sp. BMG51109]